MLMCYPFRFVLFFQSYSSSYTRTTTRGSNEAATRNQNVGVGDLAGSTRRS